MKKTTTTKHVLVTSMFPEYSGPLDRCPYCSRVNVPLIAVREDDGETIRACSCCYVAVSAAPIPLREIVQFVDSGIRAQDMQAWIAQPAPTVRVPDRRAVNGMRS